MCAFGMTASDERGKGYVYKPTKFMTNSWILAHHLDKFKCSGGHRHVHLLSGRAAGAAIYPDKLCHAICEGIKEQIEYDKFLSRLDKSYVSEVCSISRVSNSIQSMVRGKYVHNDEDDCEQDIYNGCEFYDDVSGGDLDKELVRKGRQLEIDFSTK